MSTISKQLIKHNGVTNQICHLSACLSVPSFMHRTEAFCELNATGHSYYGCVPLSICRIIVYQKKSPANKRRLFFDIRKTIFGM